MNLASFGKILIIAGIAIVALGAAFLFFDKIPILGKLPGDIVIKRKNLTLFFPIATSILLSLLLSMSFLIMRLFRR